jgi:hypothetical protein
MMKLAPNPPISLTRYNRLRRHPQPDDGQRKSNKLSANVSISTKDSAVPEAVARSPGDQGGKHQCVRMAAVIDLSRSSWAL